MTDHASLCGRTIHSSLKMKMLADLQDDERRMHFYAGASTRSERFPTRVFVAVLQYHIVKQRHSIRIGHT